MKNIILKISLFIIIGSTCFQFYVSHELLASLLSFASKLVFVLSFILFFFNNRKEKLNKKIHFIDFCILAFFCILAYFSQINNNDFITLFPMLMKILTIKFLLEPLMNKDINRAIEISNFVLSLIVYINFIQILLFPTAMGGVIDGNNVYLIASNYNQFGSLFILALLISSANDQINHKKLNTLILIGICIISALITGSMTIASSIVLLALMTILLRNNMMLKIANKGLFIAIAAFFITFVIPLFSVLGSQFTSELVDFLGKDITFTGRAGIWLRALFNIAYDPLSGVGLYTEEWSSTNLYGVNCHNIILQLLLQGGIVLLGFFVTVILIVKKSMLKLKNERLAQIIMSTMLIALLMTQFEVYQYSLTFIFLYYIYMIANSLKNKTNEI